MSASRLAWAVLVGVAIVVAAAAVPVSAMLASHGQPVPGSRSLPGTPGGHSWGPRFVVNFTETGLPAATNWSVSVAPSWSAGPQAISPAGTAPARGWSGSNTSNTSTVGFALPNGTYTFQVSQVAAGSALYAADPAQGSFQVNGSSAAIAISFSSIPVFSVTFSETGLPAATNWSVTLFGADAGFGGWANPGRAGPDCYQNLTQNSSNTSTVGFLLQNGSYGFELPNVTAGANLYVADPGAGTVSVDGASVTIDVAFSAVPLFAVTFSESGLAAGAFWSVQLWGSSGGAYNGSNTPTVGFELPNGTYQFRVAGPYYGWPCGLISPQFGSFTVNGAALTIDITFATETTYTVTFAESGLPAGTNWSVGLFGGSARGGGWGGGGWGAQFNGSANTTINFTVPDGTFAFFVGNVTVGSQLFVPSPASGNVAVDGAPVTVDVTFAAITLYNVTLVESGLPNGTFWSAFLFNATLGGAWNGTWNTSLSFLVPNGTYAFGIGPAANCTTIFLPSPASGNITVDGANVTIDVTFAPLTFYTVTVVETGLPANTTWYASLEIGGFGFGFNVTNGSSVGFYVPNGTYLVAAGPAWANGTVYVASPASEVVTVSGSSVTIEVTYSAA